MWLLLPTWLQERMSRKRKKGKFYFFPPLIGIKGYRRQWSYHLILPLKSSPLSGIKCSKCATKCHSRTWLLHSSSLRIMYHFFSTPLSSYTEDGMNYIIIFSMLLCTTLTFSLVLHSACYMSPSLSSCKTKIGIFVFYRFLVLNSIHLDFSELSFCPLLYDTLY
jgi:hypothetical protein